METVHGSTGSRNSKWVQGVLAVILVCNLLVSAIKIAVGFATGMPSITADGYHSITDCFSNVIGLIGTRIAHKPKDEDHTYGHARYETLASLAIVALLFILGLNVLEQSFNALSEPDFRVPSGMELALISSTLAFNLFVVAAERLAGRKLVSIILTADAQHTLSDVYVTCGVLASVLLIKYMGAPAWIDSAISFLIALMILKTACQIFHVAADELTDHIALDPAEIAKVVLSDPDVHGIHKIRSRRSGDMIYTDFHVQCDPEMKLKDVHAMTHRLEARLNERLGVSISCVIHTEDETLSRASKPLEDKTSQARDA
ncbi:MAG: cation diffusion facilitator family transporter [Fretibacterium sp.]|nr:cation diffusion facilitator family transporter [Fretibacterium sp.]